MIPYASLPYFLLIFAIALPMLVAGARGRADGRWIVGATLVLLFLQYQTSLQIRPGVVIPELYALIAFGLFEWAVLRFIISRGGKGLARMAIPLGLLPLVIAKFLPNVLHGCNFGFAGISYVTFRILDLLWAVTDGVVTKVGALDFMIYLFFFPTISSGPIDRFRRFQAEWRKRRTAAEFWQDFDAGIALIFRGLLYKYIISKFLEDRVEHYALHGHDIHGVFQYGFFYSANLFFDFAGYSAFAIGVSRWFGVKSPDNFAAPWGAPNIREFWNRWHMSLSTWFRDHVYMRFLLLALKKKWFKRKETASSVGYFVSFGLMGLWHGAEWHYIIYGFYHATLLSGFEAFTRWKKRNPTRCIGIVWKYTAHALTIFFVGFGMWIFSGRGILWKDEDPEVARQKADAAEIEAQGQAPKKPDGGKK